MGSHVNSGVDTVQFDIREEQILPVSLRTCNENGLFLKRKCDGRDAVLGSQKNIFKGKKMGFRHNYIKNSVGGSFESKQHGRCLSRSQQEPIHNWRGAYLA